MGGEGYSVAADVGLQVGGYFIVVIRFVGLVWCGVAWRGVSYDD